MVAKKRNHRTKRVKHSLNRNTFTYSALHCRKTVSTFRKTSWTWVLDCSDISVKSRFCSHWMEQKALCESERIVLSSWKSYSITESGDRVVQAVVNSPGLPSMQTAFLHTASPYIRRWLRRMECRKCEMRQGQEAWEMDDTENTLFWVKSPDLSCIF